MTSNLNANDARSWLETVWDALHSHRENCIPEGVPEYDEEWGEICTAMAWIAEALDAEEEIDGDPPRPVDSR
jgi:hypothetical protein